jgi:hypothetical protein
MREEYMQFCVILGGWGMKASHKEEEDDSIPSKG